MVSCDVLGEVQVSYEVIYVDDDSLTQLWVVS